MFKFLKEKLKGAIERFSKKVEEEVPDEVKEVAIEEKPKQEKKPSKKKEHKPKKEKPEQETKAEQITAIEVSEKPVKVGDVEVGPISDLAEEVKFIAEEKKEEKEGFFKKLFGKKKEEVIEKKEEIKPEQIEEKKEEPEKKIEEKEEEAPEAEEKKGFFAKIKEKIVTKTISQGKFDELFFDFEIALLENNVAYDVVDKIKDELSATLVDKPILRKEFGNVIIETLKKSIEDLFNQETFDIFEKIKSKKPYIIAFVGINGSGKTTTIAKFAHMLKEKGFSVVLAAADTFRAAAIQQLEKHADKLGVKIIKHNYGSDPAAVAFDAIEHAKAKNIDVVLIDTAGRMHSNENLIKEMEKIMRVAKPDLKIFVGESTTGNDCVEQAREFNQSINIDGIILSKADIDEKGGAAVSVSYVTKKPILFLGTGQDYKDLEIFNKEKILASIGL